MCGLPGIPVQEIVMRNLIAVCGLALGLAWVGATPLRAQAPATPEKAASEKPKFDQIIEGKTKVTGMWTLYHKDQLLLAEIPAAHIGREFIVLPSIAKGISQGSVLGGMSWSTGDDDTLWSFRKVDEKLMLQRRNVRFKAKANSPEASAVEKAYSDSVLFALPIMATGPSGGMLVDLTRVFMNDNLDIGRAMGGFAFMGDRSTWSAIKGFGENIEIQVAAVYSSTNPLQSFDTVPDSKGAQVGVHYSISLLPLIGANGYKPRIADDRIGYFLTAVKDFSEKNEDEHFLRYINRWDLRKKDPAIKVSPPIKPIKFWMEKTVPVYLRPTVKAGILEWNKAFEKLGYDGAVEVWQQGDNDTWDPEDINYNTFRWITAEAGFAMGPSRVDPRTGQILDADIIFDAGFLDSWNHRWETFSPQSITALAPNATPFMTEPGAALPFTHTHGAGRACSYCQDQQWQMGYAASVFLAMGEAAADGKLPEEFVHQGMKEVVMHEVGHTLGLRHNFKASAWKTLAEMADLEKGKAEGTVGSVMDYNPPNIAPAGQPQGLYYSQTVGPYDIWAIEYGYSTIEGDEKAGLAKIALRSSEPGLDYLTDEDTRGGVDSDPLSNRFDMGKDSLTYIRRQVQVTNELLPKVVDKAVKDGQGYQRARQMFSRLFGEHWRALGFAARFPGGISVSRDHKGTPNGRAPFKPIDAAQQREAMALLNESAFGAPKLDGTLLNSLASTRWSHWGMNQPGRLDYPIQETVLQMQSMILNQLLNSQTLTRLSDSEITIAADQDAYTLAEHLSLLTKGIFSELFPEKAEGEFTNRQPFINSYRRNLQRTTVRDLSLLVSQPSSAPEDARTLARMHLTTLEAQVTTLLQSPGLKLDDYSRAHLMSIQAKIKQILAASVQVSPSN